MTLTPPEESPLVLTAPEPVAPIRRVLLHEEAERLTADLQDREARRQQTHTACLEERGRS
ncbi:hypothetical protein OV450_2866 [Actinobacteria bacterium OV450]|nr:hypothetical protein OV450_2866 [Actinobacteria bacterium OV450]